MTELAQATVCGDPHFQLQAGFYFGYRYGNGSVHTRRAEHCLPTMERLEQALGNALRQQSRQGSDGAYVGNTCMLAQFARGTDLLRC